MRIYSNTYLSWPGILHLSQAARLYPGRWQNYYLYKIQSRDPTQIITYSPISLLQQNRQYYCYNRFTRDINPEKLGNLCQQISINNKPEEIWIHIPKASETNDVIAIQLEMPTRYPNITYSSLSALQYNMCANAPENPCKY